MTEPAFLGGEL